MDETRKNQYLIAAFQCLLKNSRDMIFVKDMDLVYMAATDSFATMVGNEKGADLVGKTDFDIFGQALAEKYIRDDKALLTGGHSIEDYIEPLPDKNGEKSYSSTSKYPIYDNDGRIIGLYGTARDVTEQVALEAECEGSRLSRGMLFDSVLEADLTEDLVFKISGNGWLESLFYEGRTFSGVVEEFAGRFIHPDFMADFITFCDINHFKTAFSEGVQDFNLTSYVAVRGGAHHWVEFRAKVYQSRISNTLRVIFFFNDMDEAIRQKRLLENQAATDPLTGLLNREHVMDQIRQILSVKTPEQMGALLFIDLDCFKQINDRFGHHIGDRVLEQTAQRMVALFGDKAICGRVGGDEFLLFLKHVDKAEAAEEAAQAVVEALRFNPDEKRFPYQVTCSVGIALCSGGQSPDVKLLYRQADTAMYRAKTSGKNQLSFYQDIL